jgi:hypothetical protein
VELTTGSPQTLDDTAVIRMTMGKMAKTAAFESNQKATSTTPRRFAFFIFYLLFSVLIYHLYICVCINSSVYMRKIFLYVYDFLLLLSITLFSTTHPSYIFADIHHHYIDISFLILTGRMISIICVLQIHLSHQMEMCMRLSRLCYPHRQR